MHTLDEALALAVPRARQLSDRASEFRTVLSARQEADGILADASEVRRDAGLQAELLVAEAEALSRDLTEQAMSVLDQAIGEGREQADGILAAARASAEDIRRSARAQIVTDREAFQAEMDAVRLEQASAGGHSSDVVLADLENTIRSLGEALQQARGAVTDAEVAIGLLRTETAGTLPGASGGTPEHHFARAAHSALSTTHLRSATSAASAPPVSSHPAALPGVTTEPATAELRPLGWLFRSDRS